MHKLVFVHLLLLVVLVRSSPTFFAESNRSTLEVLKLLVIGYLSHGATVLDSCYDSIATSLMRKLIAILSPSVAIGHSIGRIFFGIKARYYGKNESDEIMKALLSVSCGSVAISNRSFNSFLDEEGSLNAEPNDVVHYRFKDKRFLFPRYGFKSIKTIRILKPSLDTVKIFKENPSIKSAAAAASKIEYIGPIIALLQILYGSYEIIGGNRIIGDFTDLLPTYMLMSGINGFAQIISGNTTGLLILYTGVSDVDLKSITRRANLIQCNNCGKIKNINDINCDKETAEASSEIQAMKNFWYDKSSCSASNIPWNELINSCDKKNHLNIYHVSTKQNLAKTTLTRGSYLMYFTLAAMIVILLIGEGGSIGLDTTARKWWLAWSVIGGIYSGYSANETWISPLIGIYTNIVPSIGTWYWGVRTISEGTMILLP